MWSTSSTRIYELLYTEGEECHLRYSGKIDPQASSTTNEDQHSQIEIVQCIINN